jgi:hypothetical protein
MQRGFLKLAFFNAFNEFPKVRYKRNIHASSFPLRSNKDERGQAVLWSIGIKKKRIIFLKARPL